MNYLTSEGARKYALLRPTPDPETWNPDDLLKVSKPNLVGQQAANVHAQWDTSIANVERNTKWSPEGRRDALMIQGLKPAIDNLAGAYLNHLRPFEADTQNAELTHYRVPQVNQSNLAEFFRDREIRDYVRSLGDGAKKTLIEPLLKAADPVLSLAILRSPIPLGLIQDDAQKGWQIWRDRADPATASRIALAKESIQWADSILKVVANAVKRDATLQRKTIDRVDGDVLRHMIPAGCHELFGFQAPRAA